MNYNRLILFYLLIIIAALPSFSQNENTEPEDTKQIIYTFKIKEMIAPAAFLTVKNAIKESEKIGADYLLMELNTYGGLVESADSIRTALMRTDIPTISWINNNAASAGALISIACDSIYMSKGANIGASTVVDQDGNKMPDKYQSYMRSTMRSTAESQGRDPQIAEAMVDERIVIDGIVDSTQILTFTTSEAIENNYCEGQYNTIEDVIEDGLGISDYELKDYKPTGVNRLIAFLLHPAVNSLLLLMIMGGIWFELQTPGVGFPLLAAIIGAILFFAPLYLEGLAENWEILLFFVGIILLALEVFVIPGFGIAGILGVFALIVSLTFSLVDNNLFDFSPEGIKLVGQPFLRVTSILLLFLILFFVFGASFFRTKSFQRLVLNTQMDKEKGYTVKEVKLNNMVGKRGVVVNECKPIGRVEVEQDYFFAKSEQGWIDKDEQIEVIGTDVNNLIVRKI